MDIKLKNIFMKKFEYKLKICDMHTCGEPVRIVERIEPPIKFPDSFTILEKKEYFQENFDFLRKMVIWEPRGHNDMFGVIILDQSEKEVPTFQLLFLNNQGYAPMCGHVTLAVGRYILEKKLVVRTIPETELCFDCPCGLVKVLVEWDGNVVGNSKFFSVPAFVQNLDYEIYVPELEKTVVCDIAFGGNFYAIVSDANLGISLNADTSSRILDCGFYLFNAIKENLNFIHPNLKQLEYLYGIIVTDGKETSDVTKSLCLYGIRAFDRSPCGSGTTAILASQFFRRNMKLNETKVTQNPYLGSTLKGRLVREISLPTLNEQKSCVIVEITGRGYFIGEGMMTYEEDDDLKFGFRL